MIILKFPMSSINIWKAKIEAQLTINSYFSLLIGKFDRKHCFKHIKFFINSTQFKNSTFIFFTNSPPKFKKTICKLTQTIFMLSSLISNIVKKYRATFSQRLLALLLGDVQIGHVGGVMFLVMNLHNFRRNHRLQRSVVIRKVGQCVLETLTRALDAEKQIFGKG